MSVEVSERTGPAFGGLVAARSRWFALGVVGALLFLGCWAVLNQTAGHNQLRDTPLYEAYGDALRAGDLPYRNYVVEYPPAALVSFIVPDLTAAPEVFPSFSRSFQRWMSLCGVLMLICFVLALRGPPRPALAATVFVASSPLLLGPVMLSRFDLWPAALTIGALSALLARRERLAAVLLAVAIGAKLYALVCAPLFIVYIWRRSSGRAAVRAAAALAATLAVIFVPIVVLAPGGLAHSFTYQAARPLQIESLGAAVLIEAHHLLGLHLALHDDHSSRNIVGGLPTAVANLSTLTQLALLGLVQVLFLRGPATRERLVIAVAASVTTFVAFGKVFSPQYLIWLIPLVPLIRGRRGVLASGLLACGLALTHAWFPGSYGELATSLQPLESAEVLVRDLVIAGLALILIGWLAAPESRAAAPSETSVAGR